MRPVNAASASTCGQTGRKEAAKGLALYTPVLRRLCLLYLCIIKGNKRVDVGVLMFIRKSG
jgi:hypothetical protein